MVKKVTVRLEEDFHKELKKMLVDLDMSFQDYFFKLAEKDLSERKKNNSTT
jgi:predicted DNA-binding ribbon-helix-helix protein